MWPNRDKRFERNLMYQIQLVDPSGGSSGPLGTLLDPIYFSISCTFRQRMAKTIGLRAVWEILNPALDGRDILLHRSSFVSSGNVRKKPIMKIGPRCSECSSGKFSCDNGLCSKYHHTAMLGVQLREVLV